MERKIDAGGLTQFYVGVKEQSPVILLEYSLKEPVDPEKLQAAAIRATEVFRLFRVKLALNEKRQPVYLENGPDPCVYEDDGRPHAFGEESRGYLFRISFRGCRIRLSIHHMLTDFAGANEFLKYILRCYLHQIDKTVAISKDTISLDPDDLRDPCELFGNSNAVGYNMADKWKNELVIPNSMRYRRCETHPCQSFAFPVERLLLAARKTDSSVFPLLFWMMATAAAETYGAEDRIVVGRGAANYRPIYGSRTPLCFAKSFKTVLLPRERSLDLETQLTVQRFRMDLKLQRRTTDEELAEHIAYVKQLDGPIEDYVTDQEKLDRERREGEKSSAFFISYPGRTDLPEDIAKYVDTFYFNSPSTRGPLMATAYSWGKDMVVNMNELACEKSIVPAMIGLLEKYGVESRVTGQYELSYDYYPMEELLRGSSAGA